MRSRLLPLLVVAALGLTACGGGGASPTGGGQVDGEAPAPMAPAFPSSTIESTNAPDDAPARGDAGDNPAEVDPSATVTAAPPLTESEVPAADPQTPVVLAFDGRQVPIAESCVGADGAIRTTTEDGITITLVRGDDAALRYDSEGATAETDELTVDDSPDDNVYTATLSSEDVDPLAVNLSILDGAEDYLPACDD